MMKKKNKFIRKITKVVMVIGAEVLLFGGCLVMIYARGAGESENHETYQTESVSVTSEAIGSEETQSSLQAGTNQDKNITSGIKDDISTDEASDVSAYAMNNRAVNEESSMYQKQSDAALDEEKTKQELLYVEPISQLPELPTGCEVTSLTMALNYEGFDVEKEDLADNYLIKGRAGVNSYEEAFLGNPRDENSYGCFAPVIVKTANKYLKQQNSDMQAYDLTGTDFADLYDEIRSGYPVLVWGSMQIGVDIEYTETWNIDGKVIRWPGNEHCMVLIGFDEYSDTVTVCDPLRETEVYDRVAFEEHYNQMQKMAVVIK